MNICNECKEQITSFKSFCSKGTYCIHKYNELKKKHKQKHKTTFKP